MEDGVTCNMLFKFRTLSHGRNLLLFMLIGCTGGGIFLLNCLVYTNHERDDFEYNIPAPFQITAGDLAENFHLCFHSRDQSHISYFSKSQFRNVGGIAVNASSSKTKRVSASLLETLLAFGRVSASLRVQAAIVDPSLLLCILSDRQRQLLHRRNFTLQAAPGATVSLAVTQRHASILRRETSQMRFKRAGFSIEVVDEVAEPWMKLQDPLLYSDPFYTSHVFFRRGRWTLHLVVFLQRSDYLWHSDLLSGQVDHPIYFTEWGSAYENFTSISLGSYNESLSNISIPSDPQHFLIEIESSRFQECNWTITSNFFQKNPAHQQEKHSWLTPAMFRKRTRVALHELKRRFRPSLSKFWIWSGTLLGWYRQCDIIPYTLDIDFASWVRDVDDLEALVDLFKNDQHLTIKQRMGNVEIGLEFHLKSYGLRVDVFFMYPESNGTWYASHKPRKKYYIKYHLPNFALCSAELVGQKVLVPCQAEEVISAEYGPSWMTPKSSWNYESCAWNRGPNIYWTEEQLKTVNVDY